MTHKNTGKCGCGKTTFTVTLPKDLENYAPRKCDCDYCMKRDATYLSHPDGSLQIETMAPLTIDKHGSKNADFLTCSNCHSLVAVVFQFPSGLKGALNAKLLFQPERLQDSVVVSPKRLDPEEKLSRWESVWLKVSISGNNHT